MLMDGRYSGVMVGELGSLEPATVLSLWGFSALGMTPANPNCEKNTDIKPWETKSILRL